MKINDIFPRDNLPNLFKKKKFKKTNKVPKLKKNTFGVGIPVGLNVPASNTDTGDSGSSDGGGADAGSGGADGGGGGGE